MNATTMPTYALPRHEALSPWNAQFVRSAFEDERYRTKANFVTRVPFANYEIQAWPTFMDSERVEEMARLAEDLAALIRQAPSRFIGQDAAALASFYRCSSDLAEGAARYVGSAERTGATMLRGDFLIERGTLVCCEYNVGLLGGWESGLLATLVLGNPLIAEFLERRDLEGRSRDPLRAFCSHVLDATARGSGFGEANVALVEDRGGVAPRPGVDAELSFANGVYSEVANGRGLTGSILYVEPRELKRRRGGVFVEDTRIHAILSVVGTDPPDLAAAVAASEVRTFTGPEVLLLNEKLGLALLWEALERGALSTAEAALVRAHVPWTCKLAPVRARPRGTDCWLPDEAIANQGDYVLKPSNGKSGEGIIFGRNTSALDWEAAIAAALDRGDHVLQRAVSSPSYVYQDGECGVGLYGVVWGPFVFGASYAGSYVRTLRRSTDAPLDIVNVDRGASMSSLIEIHAGRSVAR